MPDTVALLTAACAAAAWNLRPVVELGEVQHHRVATTTKVIPRLQHQLAAEFLVGGREFRRLSNQLHSTAGAIRALGC